MQLILYAQGPADAGYKTNSDTNVRQVAEAYNFLASSLPKIKLLCLEDKEGDASMSIVELYKTAAIPPRSVRRIRSVLALSTLILGSFLGYWFVIEYVLP